MTSEKCPLCLCRFGCHPNLEKAKFPKWHELTEYFREMRYYTQPDELAGWLVEKYTRELYEPQRKEGRIMPAWSKEQVKLHITDHSFDEPTRLMVLCHEAGEVVKVLEDLLKQKRTSRELRRLLAQTQANSRMIKRELQRRRDEEKSKLRRSPRFKSP